MTLNKTLRTCFFRAYFLIRFILKACQMWHLCMQDVERQKSANLKQIDSFHSWHYLELWNWSLHITSILPPPQPIASEVEILYLHLLTPTARCNCRNCILHLNSSWLILCSAVVFTAACRLVLDHLESSPSVTLKVMLEPIKDALGLF